MTSQYKVDLTLTFENLCHLSRSCGSTRSRNSPFSMTDMPRALAGACSGRWRGSGKEEEGSEGDRIKKRKKSVGPLPVRHGSDTARQKTVEALDHRPGTDSIDILLVNRFIHSL